MSHSGVSSLSGVWDQYGPLQLRRTQYRPPLAKSENCVPTLERRLGEKPCLAVKEINHIITLQRLSPPNSKGNMFTANSMVRFEGYLSWLCPPPPSDHPCLQHLHTDNKRENEKYICIYIHRVAIKMIDLQDILMP